jgi:hypothetical protein
MNERDVAKYLAGGRAAIGILLLLFPRWASRAVWGEAGTSPAAAFFCRLAGARDVILGAGALAAADADGGIRPWMTYGAAADAADAVATLLAYRHLPKRKRFALLAAAAGSSATGGYLASR